MRHENCRRRPRHSCPQHVVQKPLLFGMRGMLGRVMRIGVSGSYKQEISIMFVVVRAVAYIWIYHVCVVVPVIVILCLRVNVCGGDTEFYI